MELITRKTAKVLVASGAVRRIVAKATTSGFAILFNTGPDEYLLEARTEARGLREFKSLTSVSKLLQKEFGVRFFEVDMGSMPPNIKGLF